MMTKKILTFDFGSVSGSQKFASQKQNAKVNGTVETVMTLPEGMCRSSYASVYYVKEIDLIVS